MNNTEHTSPDLAGGHQSSHGETDRYIFKPRKHFGRFKALLILAAMVAWCLGMLFFLEEYQEPLPDASETKEEQLDWRQRPGTIFRTSDHSFQ